MKLKWVLHDGDKEKKCAHLSSFVTTGQKREAFFTIALDLEKPENVQNVQASPRIKDKTATQIKCL